MRYFIFLFNILGIFISLSASPFNGSHIAHRPTIKTLHTSLNADGEYDMPILQLNGEQNLTFSFDEIGGDIQNYYYTIEHCNADWSPSSLSTIEWAEGFVSNPLNDAMVSYNTTQNYVHYQVSLPNEDVQLKVSGNYLLHIHEADDPEQRVATFSFYVTTQDLMVSGEVHARTLKEINKRYQQVDFEVITGNYPITNPTSEIKVKIVQNNRLDTEKWLEPSYIGNGKLIYKNNPELVFEGGVEYQTIDFSSRFSYGEGIERIRFADPMYVVDLYPKIIDVYKSYEYKKDANGKFVINQQEWEDDVLTADYFLVRFSIPTEAPFFDGGIYIIGEMNQNQMNLESRMTYNAQLKCYEKILLLKQGGYNFVYAFKEKGKKQATLLRTEGSYWQTENEYTIFVYHRGFGERYDKLLSVRSLTN